MPQDMKESAHNYWQQEFVVPTLADRPYESWPGFSPDLTVDDNAPQ